MEAATASPSESSEQAASSPDRHLPVRFGSKARISEMKQKNTCSRPADSGPALISILLSETSHGLRGEDLEDTENIS